LLEWSKPGALRPPILAALCLSTLLLGAGCSGLPSFTLGPSTVPSAPVGPKVAALIANFKCELLQAANSDKELPYYDDLPSLRPRNRDYHNVPEDRLFNLRNIFKEIEYVGVVTFTLDVTNNPGFNPSDSFTQIFSAPIGLLPATTTLLSVGGQLSQAAKREITINQSVDFNRLVGLSLAERHPRFADRKFTSPARNLPTAADCNQGSELGGYLGLEEVLATGMISAAMNDLSVFPNTEQKEGPSGGDPFKPDDKYSFGQIEALIDFTITENIGGGPTWVLRHFNVGAGGSGLFSFNRSVEDKLAVTFIPVCIREKYASRPLRGQARHDYEPPMVIGTPGWANYLPECAAIPHARAVAAASAKAQDNNAAQLLRNAVTTR
jgi:hypothetical protein